MKRRHFGQLAFATMAMLIGAPALKPRWALAQGKKTITGGFDVGPGGFPGNFNPYTATAGFTWLNTYFEPLVTNSADLSKLEGALASGYEVSDDGLSYTFTLVEQPWHDGTPFSSADVKFSFEFGKNADTGSLFAARLAGVASIETPDERTAVVKLSAPNAGFLPIITQVMMLPAHILSDKEPAELGKSDWWSKTPVGTGPFKFVQYVSDQYVELAAFDGYRAGRPKIDTLINRYFANAAAAVAALKAGEIQFTFVEPDDAKTFEGNADFRVIAGDSYVVNFIGFNHKSGLWDDVRVRQAVMHAIDRKTIVASLYGGAAKIADCGWVAEQIVPDGLDHFDYDPAKAKALLDEAGWNHSEPIPWITYYNSPQVANVMAAVQAMLAQVGINVAPQAMDVPSYNGIVRGDKYDQYPLVYAGAQNGPFPGTLNVNLNGKQQPPAGNNIMHIDIPELNAAIESAMAETDPDAAPAKWQEACRITNETVAWGSMWVASRYGVVSSGLADFVWTPAPAGGPFAMHPELWDVKA